jgi:hypothetical protein
MMWMLANRIDVQKLVQVWFPGVHCNVGGGNDDQELADITLAWMMFFSIVLSSTIRPRSDNTNSRETGA